MFQAPDLLNLTLGRWATGVSLMSLEQDFDFGHHLRTLPKRILHSCPPALSDPAECRALRAYHFPVANGSEESGVGDGSSEATLL